MSDQIAHAMAYEGRVRIFAAVTTELASKAQETHDTWPTATAALGRTLTAATLMSAMGDADERLTLQILGNGPLGRIVAVANGHGKVKGYVDNPHVHLELNSRGKLDVGKAVGKGQLYVLRDIGLKEPYRGVVDLVSGEIGDDIAQYYYSSEQTRSAVALGVRVAPDGTVLGAGGYILQLLPGAGEDIISLIEERIMGIPDLSSLIEDGERPKDLLQRLAGESVDLEFAPSNTEFYCDCNRERLIGPLISLGKDELCSLADEEKDAELVCNFCQAVHRFSPDELRSLAAKAEISVEKLK
jgi:molecular chaperone Hsp33